MLFGVDTTNELRRAIEQAMAQKASYYNGMSVIEFSIPRLPSAVPLDRLASVPLMAGYNGLRGLVRVELADYTTVKAAQIILHSALTVES